MAKEEYTGADQTEHTGEPTRESPDPSVTNPPEPTPEPVAPQVETPEAPAATSTPWQKDLEAKFNDPAQRQAVDEFLRETVQPHVTKLEQDSVPNRDAQQLWDDFTQNPIDTYRAVTTELFGEEQAAQIDRALNAEVNEETGQLETPEGDQVRSEDIQDPRVKAVVEAHEESVRQKDYFDALAQTKAKYKDTIEINDELFHPFVAAADGDMDAAVQGYSKFVETAKTEYGAAPAGEAAPPVVDSTTQTGSEPPTTQKQTLDQAIDSFLEEQKSPPTTVGSV
jgi:hypothetical protein